MLSQLITNIQFNYLNVCSRFWICLQNLNFGLHALLSSPPGLFSRLHELLYNDILLCVFLGPECPKRKEPSKPSYGSLEFRCVKNVFIKLFTYHSAFNGERKSNLVNLSWAPLTSVNMIVFICRTLYGTDIHT